MQLNNKTTPSLISLVAVSNYKNTDVVKHYGNMTINTAIQSTTKGIGVLSKHNELQLKRCITNMFIGTSMYFDNVLSQNKADVIAEELLAKYEYRQLKLEDILAICIEIKEGETFKLTPARILRQVKDYYSRREKLIVNQAIQQSQNHKSSLGEASIDKRLHNSIRHLERSNQEIVKGRVKVKKFYK